MVFLKSLFIIVEVLCCLMLIGLILLQKSKNEGLGMAFGAGVGESLFGARAGNVLSKATVILGIVFMANTLLLGIIFAQRDKTLMDQAPVAAAQPAAMQGQPTDAVALEDQPIVEPIQSTEAADTGAGGAYVDPDMAEVEAGAAIATAKKAMADAEKTQVKAETSGAEKPEAEADQANAEAIQAIHKAIKANTKANEAVRSAEESP